MMQTTFNAKFENHQNITKNIDKQEIKCCLEFEILKDFTNYYPNYNVT